MDKLSKKMHKIKMKRRYGGKKIPTMKEKFLKTANQRRSMKRGKTQSQIKKELKQRKKDKKPTVQSRLTDYV